MAYTYSKTNWTANDTFELTDWARIRANFFAICDELVAMTLNDNSVYSAITDFTSNLDRPFYDDVNTLENALQNLYDVVAIHFHEWLPSKEWTYRTSPTYDSVGNPTFNDWNRWEVFLKRMWETIQYQQNYKYQLVSGMSYAGTNMRVQILSRGR